MHTIPGGLSTDRQPPTAIPLGHFVVALAFMLVGLALATASAIAPLPGMADPALAHLLLVGWICLTIMGAMTQFVPVWSGAALHSKRLAVAQLVLVACGLIGVVAAFLTGAFAALPVAALALLAGVWTFVYNVGRTLVRAAPSDVTEVHFGAALLSFAALAPLGFSLALDLSTPVFEGLPVARADVILAHATLAVFGAVLTTVAGAIYQLAKMFTQAELAPIDRRLQRFETAALPAGAVVLAAGRGLGSAPLARLGAVALLLGCAALAVVVARLLLRSTVGPSPVTARYRVVVASLFAWAALAAPAWWADPLAYDALFGRPGSATLLVVGVFGFVVVGTLYHVVPFIVWFDRYSDRVGLERVPTIDDLYDDRIERADLAATLVGAAGLVAGDLFSLPAAVLAGSGVVATLGFALFAANLLSTIRRHGPGGLRGVATAALEASGD